MSVNAFYAALSITVVLTAILMAVLHRPLRRILGEDHGRDPLAQFWGRYTEAFLVLIPLTFLVFGGVLETQYHQQFVVQVLHLAKWSMIGLLVAMVTVGVLVAGVIRPMRTPLWVAPHQINDMERLLAKVDQIRARETLHRLAEPSES